MFDFNLTKLKRWMILILSLLGATTVHTKSVYRCPGPPPLYTDNLSEEEARKLQCDELSHIPLTVPQPQHRAQSSKDPHISKGTQESLSRPAEANNANIRIPSAEQKARDKDAKRILQEELKREEALLQTLDQEFNGGQPERQANEQNYQRYLDRVAQMKDNITRKKADIEAIRRELAKLPSANQLPP